jgi:NSS family neurotransmitter:Na+ symporter
LAAVGSAVGLGNAWRFPGLASKHGGGAFLLVYLVVLFALGIPLLAMEISIARRMKQGAAGSMRGLNRKFEPIGWMATANAFVIVTYYAMVFGWVLLMIVGAVKFAGMTGDADAASNLWMTLTQTTGDVPHSASDWAIPIPVLLSLIVSWLLIYYCIRDGAASVGKVVKYTVFVPVILLIVMAIKGIMMPGAVAGLKQFFIPDVSAFADSSLWIDAIGQVFFSLSIMMAIMFAYGSYLDDGSNIAVDTIIIALSDMAVSVLSGIVMYSTMGGVGMLDSMTASGISTAFIVYPVTIVNLTSNGTVNAIFGVIFYLMLATLAIDSAFSIVEGVSASVADKFRLDRKKTTIGICCVAAVISLVYATRSGLAWLDIVDNWTNQFNLIFIGILEALAVGWGFGTKRVLDEVNRNTKNFKMPAWWFSTSVRFVAPALLIIIFVWNVVSIFRNGGIYGYTAWAEIIAGWFITFLVLISGFIIRKIVEAKEKKGFVEPDETWDDMER